MVNMVSARTNARAGKCALTQTHAYANARKRTQIKPALSNVPLLFATFSSTAVSVILHFDVSYTSADPFKQNL